MVEFLPLNGIRYNSRKISDLSAVVAPPYDVIAPAEQENYYARHPHNVIRLILGRTEPGDDERNNAPARAAVHLDNWLREAILIQEPEPAFYLTATTFNHEGRRFTRTGIIGRVKLRPFEEGDILPHECTFSKVKTEQLRLMQACRANLSPVFGLCADCGGLFSEIQKLMREQPPAINFTDDHQLHHGVWFLTDPRHTASLSASLRGHRIYIADGHHRYETALNYRDYLSQRNPALPANHPANYVLISLSGIEDPGMIVLPAHRLLKDVPGDRMRSFISRSHAFFEVVPFGSGGGGIEALAQAKALQKEFAAQNAITAIVRPHDEIFVLRLKPGVMKERYPDEPESLRSLDVTVLTRLVLMELLGYDQANLDDENRIFYRTDALECLHSVRQGSADMAFIMNPTRIDQVRRVSEEGLIMPRKSTYFFPKVISGLVINPLW